MWDTLVENSCGLSRAIFLETLLQSPCATLILVGQFRKTLLWDTLVRHSHGNHFGTLLLWDTLAGHSCRTLSSHTVWDTLAGHSCFFEHQDQKTNVILSTQLAAFSAMTKHWGLGGTIKPPVPTSPARDLVQLPLRPAPH